MNKTLLRTAVSTLGLALSLAMSSAACAGHHEKSEKDAQQAMAMSAEEQAAMQAMAAAGALGEPHARLAKGVGEYDAAMQFWMAPDAEPLATNMTVVRELEMGGRVLVDHWRGNVMGQPFVGMGRTGYDNVTKRYWSTWTDNTTTGVLVMYGTYNADKDVVEYTGSSVNAITGQAYKMRSVGPMPGEGEETMTMYEDHGQGEYTAMRFTLTPR